MLIKSLKLYNIRSYTIQKIDFPEGTILLSGDIGAGKSTILLAIEFALFGLRRSYLSGATLLRHGKNEGSIELNLEVEKNDILIKRTLKRIKEDVAQNEGYVVMNGIKKNCSPIELRAEVFNILGYSKDLLTKNKDIVYRYTVYTPQEEMKQILTEDNETRLDILRMIFNIDKYKRIKENSVNILSRELREKKRYIELMSSDLDTKKQEKRQREQNLTLIAIELKSLAKSIHILNEQITKNRQLKQEYELKIKISEKIKNEMKINDSKIKNMAENLKENQNSILRIRQNIEILKKSIDTNLIGESEKIIPEIKAKESEIKKADRALIELTSEISKLRTEKANTEDIIKRISSLDICPSCFQNVPHEHKSALISKENNKLFQFSQQIPKQNSALNEIGVKLQKAKQELNELKQKQEQIKIMGLRLDSLKEKNIENERLELLNNKLSVEIKSITLNNEHLNKELEKFKGIENDYISLQQQVESLMTDEKSLSIKKARLDNELDNINKLVTQLDKEIKEKEELKKQLIFLNELNAWTNDFFLNLMDIIEKHIMLNIYYEFNSLFQKWFSALIDDETISVRIDNEFTPIIEQNGYDTSLENLSGGEKTSVALAYRLALNKVINDIISGINTKDILMLDEPTDGFSTEQLDKVRDVLNQIGVKQLIIVSHEPKIEGFVNHIIRISKDGHESCVM